MFRNACSGQRVCPFQGGASFVDQLCYFCLVLLCFHTCLFVDALWSLAGKRERSGSVVESLTRD